MMIEQWSERRLFELAGLMTSVLVSNPYLPLNLNERLLLEDHDLHATPQEGLFEAPPFDEVDIQALAHAVELTRKGAVDSLKFAKGDLFHAFKDSKPTVDLRPTFGEYLTEWWTFNNELLKNYIPRNPTQTPDIFDAYLLKVVSGRQRKKYSRIMTTSIPTVPRSKISMLKDHVITDLKSCIFKLEAIIQVLVCKTKGVVIDKLEFSEDFPNLIPQFCDELNKEFLNLFDSPSISSGTCCSDLDIDEDVDEEYLLQEQFRMKLEEEEMLLFKEEQILGEESKLRLEEEAKMMREEENHMKQAMARVVPKKRSHCTGVTSSSWQKVSNKFKDKSLGRCVINQDMTEFLKSVKPWSEDLSRCNTSIDNVWLTEDLDLYLGKPGMLRCRFPWCNDQMVDRKFWESLVCLDPTRTGWLLDDHIDLWVEYMWHVRPKSANWAMLIVVFKLITKHWNIVPHTQVPRHTIRLKRSSQACIGTMIYWVASERVEKLPKVLELCNVFDKKCIDPNTYRIKFTIADNVPKQGGVFGDCGVWVCIFLYRLAHGISLDVEDPIQTALAYQERMARFYFQHKVV
ncbi:phospholipase-like protein [Tanacetum coccineum]